MSEHGTRRDLLRNLAWSATLGGLDPVLAQHVHTAVTAEKRSGAYQPKFFQPEEWRTLVALCERIVPGATQANAAEFIDLIASENPRIAATWTGGLQWLNRETRRASGKAFADAPEAAQTEQLDRIAYREKATPETAAAVRFFDLARKMTVDAYYTSAAGIAELGYLGNQGQSEFLVPEDLVAEALKRSGLA